jgi:hypothetical protein
VLSLIFTFRRRHQGKPVPRLAKRHPVVVGDKGGHDRSTFRAAQRFSKHADNYAAAFCVKHTNMIFDPDWVRWYWICLPAERSERNVGASTQPDTRAIERQTFRAAGCP